MPYKNLLAGGFPLSQRSFLHLDTFQFVNLVNDMFAIEHFTQVLCSIECAGLPGMVHIKCFDARFGEALHKKCILIYFVLSFVDISVDM